MLFFHCQEKEGSMFLSWICKCGLLLTLNCGRSWDGHRKHISFTAVIIGFLLQGTHQTWIGVHSCTGCTSILLRRWRVWGINMISVKMSPQCWVGLKGSWVAIYPTLKWESWITRMWFKWMPEVGSPFMTTKGTRFTVVRHNAKASRLQMWADKYG